MWHMQRSHTRLHSRCHVGSIVVLGRKFPLDWRIQGAELGDDGQQIGHSVQNTSVFTAGQ